MSADCAPVADLPETRFAKSGEVNIAYQILGDGPIDIVVLPAAGHPMMLWEEEPVVGSLRRLASFSRVIAFHQRGTGRSDPVSLTQLPTLQERLDDLVAVLDAAKSQQPVIAGFYDGGHAAMLFAATYPERTSALILCNAFPRTLWAEDWPWGTTEEFLDEILAGYQARWGTGVVIETFDPALASDPEVRQRYARLEQAIASPGQAAALTRVSCEVDVRDVLPSIQATTLVIRTTGGAGMTEQQVRYLAEHIPAATYVEVPEGDTPLWGLGRPLLDEIEGFVTGTFPAPDPDRVLATVLFTDIVGSTDLVAEVGDKRWRMVLSDHDAMTRRLIERFRGREVKRTGDGFLATFDGPARAIRCACAIRDGVRQVGVEIRAGVHAGEVELLDGDIGGLAVHIAQRVSAMARPGEVIVSSTVKDLVAGSGLQFDDRGEQELKGVPGTWKLFSVKG